MVEQFASVLEHPLNPVCQQWLKKIKLAEDVKRDRFQQYADEAMKFFDGEHNWMWSEEYAASEGGFLDKNSFGSGGLPTFRIQINKLFDAVSLIGPSLMHRYPQVRVTPVRHPEVGPVLLGIDVQDEQAMQQFQMRIQQNQMQEQAKANMAELKEHYLNWLQVEGNKRKQAQRGITECIVKGMGCLWTEMYEPRGSKIKYPRSVYVSCDDIVKDMDAEYDEDVQWIARQRRLPVNVVEEIFGLQPGEIKGHMESLGSQGDTYGSKREQSSRKRSGRSYDTLLYWEVYSKNGFGDLLKQDGNKKVKSEFDFSVFGKHTYLAVAKNIPYPLNIPSWSFAEGAEALFERAQWPIPFWADSGSGGGWPYSELRFYDKPKSVWPIALAKPCIGELRFVNWAMSFLADKTAAASTTYVTVAKAAGAQIQDQISGGLAPFTVVEIENLLGMRPGDMVEFMQAPNFNIEIWNMVSQVMQEIDKRMGLSPLMYGQQSTQDRSAAVSRIKDQNLQIRPDDMSEKTEAWYSESASKEMMAACWLLQPEDVLPVLGEDGAQAWKKYLETTEFDTVVRDYKYRVEAGSARKPNKQERMASLQEFSQAAMPMIQQVAAQGNFQPWNALMSDIGDALEMDSEPYLIPPPPPPPQEPEQEGPSPEQMQAQAEQQKAQIEMQKLQLDLQLKQVELQFKQQEQQLEMQGKQQDRQFSLQSKRDDLGSRTQDLRTRLMMDQQKHVQELTQDREVHDQDMDQDADRHDQDMDFLDSKSSLQIEANRRNGNGSQ